MLPVNEHLLRIIHRGSVLAKFDLKIAYRTGHGGTHLESQLPVRLKKKNRLSPDVHSQSGQYSKTLCLKVESGWKKGGG
jgi:hypothetical protein